MINLEVTNVNRRLSPDPFQFVDFSLLFQNGIHLD